MALSAGSSTGCTTPCSGNPTEFCGGSGVNSVYQTLIPSPPNAGAVLCPISSGCVGFDLTPSNNGVCGTGTSAYNPACVNCPFGTSSLNMSATCWQNFINSSTPALVSSISGRSHSYQYASDVNLLVNGSYANGAWAEWGYDMGGVMPFLCTSCTISASNVSWILVIPQTVSPLDQPQAAILRTPHKDLKMVLVTITISAGQAFSKLTLCCD
jgi:hypothetical protein